MSLDAPTPSGPPQARFPNVGDSIVVGIVDVGEYQQTDYDTREPKKWPDGKPVMGKVVTGLVVSTAGTTDAGNKENHGPVAPGDLVTFWCEGGKFFTYRDALKAHGPVDIGDVMQWQRAEDGVPTNPRHNPPKKYEARIRKPEAKDGDLPDRCRQAHNELKAARTASLDEPVTDGAPVHDETPF